MDALARDLRQEAIGNDLNFAYYMMLDYLKNKTVFDAAAWEAAFWQRLANKIDGALPHDAPEKVAAIRARLAAAPGLPWAVNEQVQQIWSPGSGNYIGTEGTIADPEIRFMVNASEDIAYLLSLIESKRIGAI